MKTWNIFESNDELVEWLESELSRATITLASTPGHLSLYFALPTEHSRYGGVVLQYPLDLDSLISKAQEARNTPGESVLLTLNEPPPVRPDPEPSER